MVSGRILTVVDYPWIHRRHFVDGQSLRSITKALGQTWIAWTAESESSNNEAALVSLHEMRKFILISFMASPVSGFVS